MAKRRKTNTISIGKVKVGCGYPVSIQSMTKTKTSCIKDTVSQIRGLEEAGCEIIRVAVKDLKDAKAISEIKKEITIPLVADIHFDYKLALSSINNGADKIRINPGNIQKKQELDQIIDLAASKSLPIRVGVNSGSLPEGKDTAHAMVGFVLKYLEVFQNRDFNEVVLSLKASCVATTVDAYRLIAKECDYPLHLGVTASGLPEDGVVKSSIGIGSLLLDGIGDTIRVSLTGDAKEEIYVAKKILEATGLRSFGLCIISCPTCGRCQVDLVSIARQVQKAIETNETISKDKTLTIAIMGCEVNGPGEAKAADIGIAFGKEKGAIFKKGEIIKTVPAIHAVKELINIIINS